MQLLGYEKAKELPQENKPLQKQREEANSNEKPQNIESKFAQELPQNETQHLHTNTAEQNTAHVENNNEIHKNQDSIIKSTGNNNTENEMKEAKPSNTYTFIDSKGQEREIPQEVAQKWLDTFELKDLQESYTPKFSKEVKEALEKAGIKQDFNLLIGSLIKLINKDRLAVLPKIKETIETPNKIIDDGMGILFIKEFADSDKNRYFMSIAKNYNGEWIFSSHVRRELANIENKIKNGKVIYDKGFKGG